MDKSVLISIRPKWCEKIVNGEKTIEVRKTRPKLQTPFKCYIYCTMDHPYISVSCGELDKLNYRTNTVCRCNGKVIGEFTCDRIDRLAPANDPYGIYDIDDDYVFQTCLEMGHYGIMDTEHRFTAGTSPACAFMICHAIWASSSAQLTRAILAMQNTHGNAQAAKN